MKVGIVAISRKDEKMKKYLRIMLVFVLLFVMVACTDNGNDGSGWSNFVREWKVAAEKIAQERDSEKYPGFHLSNDCEYVNDFSYMPCDWIQQLQGECEMHPSCSK
jgi:hypothetical protein